MLIALLVITIAIPMFVLLSIAAYPLWFASLLSLLCALLLFVVIEYVKQRRCIQEASLLLNSYLPDADQQTTLPHKISCLGEEFKSSQRELVAIMSNSKRLRNELSLARELQRRMLPYDFKQLRSVEQYIDIYADLLPAHEVCGDFYDCFYIDRNRLFLMIGDVCGKGIPACMLMARIVTLTRSLLATSDYQQPDKGLPELLTQISKVFNKYESQQCLFATAFVAIINTTTGELHYANAGHNPALIINKDYANQLSLSSSPLGLSMSSCYQSRRHQMQENDSLILYTDGVVESQNKQGDYFSEQRLVNSLRGRKHFGANLLVTGLMHDLQRFTGHDKVADDVTVMAMTWKSQQKDKADLMQFSQPVLRQNKLNYVSSDLVINQIQVEIHSLLLACKIAKSVIQDILLSCEEIVVNLKKYSFHPDIENHLVIQSNVRKNFIELQFIDDALPFDISNIPNHLPAKNDQGGRGVFLIKNLMDEVRYTSTDRYNVLQVVKHYC